MREPCAYVYVLGCQTAQGYRTYVGWTLDLDRRLAEHNGQGKAGAKSTRGRIWQLIYAMRLENRRAAMQAEWQLKQARAFRKQLALSAQGQVTVGRG